MNEESGSGKAKENRLSLCDEECYRETKRSAEPGLCFSKFRADLLIPDLGEVAIGKKLTVKGETLLITELKHCYGNSCTLSNKAKCPLRRGACFAKRIYDSLVNIEDKAN